MLGNSILPRSGEIYQHFKGNMYLVVGCFKHSETQEMYVSYVQTGKSIHAHEGWVRPASMWFDVVDRPDYDYNGPRFSLKFEGFPTSTPEEDYEEKKEEEIPEQTPPQVGPGEARLDGSGGQEKEEA